jgi:hypothetical protein
MAPTSVFHFPVARIYVGGMTGFGPVLVIVRVTGATALVTGAVALVTGAVGAVPGTVSLAAVLAAPVKAAVAAPVGAKANIEMMAIPTSTAVRKQHHRACRLIG